MAAPSAHPRPRKRRTAQGAGQPHPEGSFGRSGLLTVLGIAVLALVAYLPAFRSGFVWDDIAVTENPVIAASDGLWRMWFDPRANVLEDHYWPLVYSAFWVEFRLWGLHPAGYHAVNLVLHAANSVLVWLLLRRLGAPGAALAGALFAVHPIHVESVAWIIERKDVMSAFLGLLSAWCFLSYVDGRRRVMQAGAVVLLVGALLCKSIVVTQPVALLLVLWWRRGKVTRQDLVDAAPLAGAATLVAVLDFSYLRHGGNELLGLSLGERMVIAGRAGWWYLGRLVVPYPLMPIHPRWDATIAPVAWLWLLSLVGFLGLLFAIRGRIGRGPFSAVLFSLLTVSPVLGLVPHGFMRFSFVAERFAYLASIGMVALLASVGAPLLDKARVAAGGGRRRPLAYAGGVAGILIVVAYGALTFAYASAWRDAETLWQHAVRANPGAYEAHHQLATAFGQAGRMDDAVAAFEAALRLKPDYAEARANYALALEVKGDRASALREAERAVRDKPDYAEGHNKYGTLLARSGRVAEAVPQFEAAVRIQPWNADARENLELARSQLGTAR